MFDYTSQFSVTSTPWVTDVVINLLLRPHLQISSGYHCGNGTLKKFVDDDQSFPSLAMSQFMRDSSMLTMTYVG